MLTSKSLNPIVSSPEYKSLVAEYKALLNKYQPGNWYFGCVERGEKFNKTTRQWDNSMTIEDMKEMVKGVSPVGPAVNMEDVEDVSFTYEELKEKFPQGDWYDYHAMHDWLSTQSDIYKYCRGNEDFSRYEAFQFAAGLGYKKVYMENLS